MCTRPLNRLFLALLALAATAAAPSRMNAQLVRDAPPQKAVSPPSKAQDGAAGGKLRLTQDVSLSGGDHWMDTGIDARAGERVVITASGALRYADAPEQNGPQGLSRGWKDLLRILPLRDAGRGALVGRIGDQDTGQPFLVGAKSDFTVVSAGRLYLGINQDGNDSAEGSYSAHIEVHEPDKTVTPVAFAARDVKEISGVDGSLFSKMPRRVADKDGNPGDMVNFILLGPENAMQHVFERAGWVKVDRAPRDAVLTALIESLSKEAYVQMPMSQLYLFGRYQDYGFAHADPVAVVATRHHLRLWKAPFTAAGQTVWVGAATHDTGFERDRRNNGITHKIDPNVDAERDYVEKTLSATGLVTEKTHFVPDHALKEAKTATGASFHSSGQVLVLKLAEVEKNAAAKR